MANKFEVVYGDNHEVSLRLDSTDIFVKNGDKTYKVAELTCYNGRERDSFNLKWDRNELKKFLPEKCMKRYVDDSCESGTRKKDWWDPIGDILGNDLKELNKI